MTNILLFWFTIYQFLEAYLQMLQYDGLFFKQLKYFIKYFLSVCSQNPNDFQKL